MEENEVETVEKKNDENVVKKKPNDEKSKYDNINLDQELLGSVTTINNPGLRTSARVIQKMKQDSIRPLTPPPTDKKDGANDKGLQRTPSQTRPPKVIWSNFEKNMFFDALNEFGKDFEAIANFVNSKSKRKSAADQSFKTKDQARQMYYTTYHKIVKYLKFSDDVKKPAQELYALINYGEMRRKLAFVSEKNCMKMKDLVYKGHVTVRSKGKNIRIKTPPCKALRKLNQLDDWQEDINLPAKIEVCLKPANMDAWARVQTIAQNPLVQAIVPLQKKLTNLIKTFQYKWRNEETKLALQSLAMVKNNQHSKSEVKTANETDESNINEPLICLCPATDAVIHRPLLSITEFLSSFNICLNAYEQKIGVKVRGESLWNKRQISDSGCEKKSPEAKKAKFEPDSKSDLKPVEINLEANAVAAENNFKDEAKEQKAELNEITNSNHSNADDLHELLLYDGNMPCLDFQEIGDSECTKKLESLINCSDNAVGACMPQKPEESSSETVPKSSSDVKHRKKDAKCAGHKKRNHGCVVNMKPLLDEETERKIRKGWTILNASDISVGDLYITFGHDSKITFEYYWLERDVERQAKKSTVPYNINSVNKDSLKVVSSSHISNKLRHLLLLASLTERVKRKPCGCGHVCEKGAKKKTDGESTAKTFVSNKTYTTSKNDCVFRQPTAPFRRPGLSMENYRLSQNGFRYNHARLMMKGRNLSSKQVVVQRLLPVQPGMNQSYDLLTPEVHLRKVVETPKITLPPWVNGNAGSSDASDKNQKPGGDVNAEKEVVAISAEEPKIEEAVQQLSLIASNSADSRPFKVLSQNDESSTTCTSTEIIEQNGVPKSIGIILSTKDEIFSSSSNNGSDIDENGIAKIVDMDEDPGIQELMEISLPSPAPVQCLDDSSDLCSIPPMSPMRLIRDSPSDPKWLEENLSDFSLSSFLGHLDEMNRDVDSMSVISESSQDYMSKFAEIAASMQNEDRDL